MALTLTLTRNLRYVFYDIFRNTYYTSFSYLRNNENTFSKWLEVDLLKNDIEIPTFVKGDIRRLTEGVDSAEDSNVFSGTVYIPIHCRNSFSVKTGDAIINTLFRSNSASFIKVITPKGTYYGNSGIILDSNFNVIFLITLNCHKEGTNILYTRANIYIHPKVFLEEKEVLHSCILKKLIPFYLRFTVDKFQLGFDSSHPQYNLTPQIIIKDVTSDFINTASVPNPQSTSNESINQFLIDHQEDIIDQI